MVSVLPVGWMSESDLLRAATAVACGAGHPAAAALLRAADLRVVRVVDARNCERAPSGGAVGVVAGSRILLGDPDLLLEHGVDLTGVPAMPVHDGMFFVASDGRFAGLVVLDEAAFDD
ncbi:MAG: hypothetical protein U0625_12025 [Phycisphaerales bacterium]